jgi:hypothetical protein
VINKEANEPDTTLAITAPPFRIRVVPVEKLEIEYYYGKISLEINQVVTVFWGKEGSILKLAFWLKRPMTHHVKSVPLGGLFGLDTVTVFRAPWPLA